MHGHVVSDTMPGTMLDKEEVEPTGSCSQQEERN